MATYAAWPAAESSRMENAACSATENDGDEMQIVLAALSLALLMWVEAASAQSTYSMSVSRHSSVPSLSEAEVREILASASKRWFSSQSTGNIQ